MIKLNKDLIYEYQQNREPYLMIDEAINVVPGKSAIGYKDFNEDEWFFKVHWPKDPNVPGMLQVEALTQMSALSILTLEGNKGQIMYLNTRLNEALQTKLPLTDPFPSHKANPLLKLSTFVSISKRELGIIFL